ncbi:uncharacterized protein LOC106651565 [Trichogramma pretiosum]|uniref:uncharacterized protein LOC106651565 n=1 Tax=Trichogramma pretiosum TaxID=7493 RepID=UPI000C71B8E8|nr:uncharacterized protein LOC106651565 [Trichogramma pretiosum]
MRASQSKLARANFNVKMSTLSALPIPDYCQVEHYYGVTAYWFASNFTQSRYPNNQESSQACTLICLLVSSGVAQAKLHIGPESYNDLLTQVIAESIISGNRAYDRIMCRRLVKHHHLSVTDALKYCCPELCHMREWKWNVYHDNFEEQLVVNMNWFLEQWDRLDWQPDYLFMVLISNGRTVLFIFPKATKSAIFFDSHGHPDPNGSHSNSGRGIVVAQTARQNLEILVEWFIFKVIRPYTNANPVNYELACLYYTRKSSCERSCHHDCSCSH